MKKKSLADKFREAGFKVEPIVVKRDPELEKAVDNFIRMMEEAHENAKNSKLRFGVLCPMGSY